MPLLLSSLLLRAYEHIISGISGHEASSFFLAWPQQLNHCTDFSEVCYPHGLGSSRALLQATGPTAIEHL